MALASLRSAILVLGLAGAAGCAHSTSSGGNMSPTPPSPDPRIGLKAGQFDAGEASWNLRVLSQTPPPKEFVGETNSDLSFTGKYVIQGNYHGYQFWDISNPAKPRLEEAYVCPASQSDVSVYKNLLFVSGEGLSGRLDCGTEGVPDTVSKERLRGLRIFDISDIAHPKNVGNVQTCRGSHTHSLLVDPKDADNVYVYISGSSSVRSPSELAGCVGALPSVDSSSALFRIEVIKVPLAHPDQAAIVSSPRIFNDLTAAPEHGETKEDLAALEKAQATGAFVMSFMGMHEILSPEEGDTLVAETMRDRGRSGAPTAEDTAAARAALSEDMAKMMGPVSPNAGPTQCHDITLYPAIGLAGGACEGYGLLLDISDPVHPKRIAAVSDSNFSYWHSATFNNDGTKVIFTDEWGGGTRPRCRATDPLNWGGDAIFDIVDRKLKFESYYKMPAPQTEQENCVAHNGSLIPVPGRDIMVQAWYQGGISVFDFTDSAKPVEIAFFDRGPIDAKQLITGGFWSAYWYNGHIYGSEIARGMDVFSLKPSEYLSQNEIDAASLVRSGEFNPQEQEKISWPAGAVVARAYLDQLNRSRGITAERARAVKSAIDRMDGLRSAKDKTAALGQLDAVTAQLETDAAAASGHDAARLRALAETIKSA
ncbi:MAG: LVIVD repeat-containing protein, partial [Gemmatimonadales bacterium]